MIPILVTALAVAALSFFPALSSQAAQEAARRCYQCHVSKSTGAYLHGPIKEKNCEACHNSTGGNHQIQKGLFMPPAKGSKLCFQCHANLATEKSIHGPIKKGECGGCHAPHSSPYRKLLQADPKGFCFKCHDKEMTSGKFGHSPVKAGACLECHLPHQSKEEKLIKPSDAGICFFCHDRSLITGKSVHIPVAAIECGSCHQIHGSDNAKLLNVPAAAPEKSSRLCYECHDNLASQKSVHGPVRQGDCGKCHVPHSSPHNRLLRADGSNLCFTCHDNKPFVRQFGHAPVKSGKCLDCHAPHQSTNAKLIKPNKGLICFECHDPSIGAGKSVHKPVAAGNCGGCHLVHGADSAKLLKPSPVVDGKKAPFCSNCHENLAVQKSVHAPVRDGKCTGCHMPHSSSAAKLLKAEGTNLCFTCHDKPKFTEKRFPHEPVKSGGCVSCHLPHQSNGPKLLKQGETPICFNCHKTFPAGKSVHKPVASGACGSCHAIHGGDNSKLLIAAFPTELQVPFSEEAYAFCFTCHDSKGFTESETTATGFRNGARNLHMRHIRGNSCKICHEFHTSPQEKLIREKVMVGDRLDYTVEFRKTATGGNCNASCHGNVSYSR